MSDYFDLTVASVKPETAKAVTLTFEVPETLQEKFHVIPGQYLKLKTQISGDDVERFYSVCDFDDKHVQVGIKRVENGLFSNFACDNIHTGDVLSVQMPQGDFCLPDAAGLATAKRYCFVAAGSGITPNLAMIKYLLENQDNCEITLIYVNAKRADIMFFGVLEDLKNTHMGRFSIVHVITREPSAIEILSKRPDDETAGQIIDFFVGTKNLDHVYLCGPLPLIDTFRAAFIERGIGKKNIHMELFGVPDSQPKVTKPIAAVQPEAPFHSLSVTEVQTKTGSSVAITFAIPENLQKDFRPVAGQYIKLRANINGENVERFYSLCDFGDDFVQVGIKKVEGGKFSNYACDKIKAGQVIEVQAPQGDFCLPNEQQIASENRYFFVAAGSGITPSLAMIKVLLTEYDNIRITLLYVNSKRADIMFFSELEDLKNTHMGRLNIIHILTREPRGIPMLSKRPDAESAAMLIDGLVGTNLDHTFMCGPLPLIELFRNVLLERGVEKKRIHMELFGTPEAPKRSVVANTATTQSITVISQGVSQNIDIRPDQDVLEAALEGGISVPFACKGGVCATCKAKRLDGEAEMVLNYGLEDDDVERGMMLTCQTFVTSETAVFDFDVQ